MLDADFVTEIGTLAVAAEAIQHIEFGDRHYTDKALIAQPPPIPAAIALETLMGLVDFTEQAKAAPKSDGYFLHIIDHAHVSMVSTTVDEWGRRLIAATAECKNPVRFEFGKYMAQENLIIGLLANFIPTEERDKLITFASNIAASRVETSTDDGTSQEVHTKKGIVLQSPGGEKAPGRIKLVPYRTFREVPQPESEFIFRLKGSEKEGDYPTCALFEADGGAWKITAVDNISRWLAANQAHGEGDKPLPVVS